MTNYVSVKAGNFVESAYYDEAIPGWVAVCVKCVDGDTFFEDHAEAMRFADQHARMCLRVARATRDERYGLRREDWVWRA